MVRSTLFARLLVLRYDVMSVGTNIELTILMPCLNEAETIATCIDKAAGFLHRNAIQGEVLVADNGSVDDSVSIAKTHGARVLSVGVKGYGAALRSGALFARGKFIIMGDADDSYDFSSLDAMLQKLRSGADLVMGNRFAGEIQPGAMPPLHRYFGNPALSFIGRVVFGSKVRDFHCGLRGAKRDSLLSLDLQSLGMEYASEMVIKAEMNGLSIAQVPIDLHVDGRSRKPHLNTWRDGWRHLRLLMIYASQRFYLVPGVIALLLGGLMELALSSGPFYLGPIRLAMGTLVVAMFLCTVGAEAIFLGITTREYALRNHYLDAPQWRYGTYFTTKAIFSFSVIVAFIGLLVLLRLLILWDAHAMRYLSASVVMGGLIPTMTLLSIASVGMFSVFMAVLDEPAGRMNDESLRGQVKIVAR